MARMGGVERFRTAGQTRTASFQGPCVVVSALRHEQRESGAMCVSAALASVSSVYGKAAVRPLLFMSGRYQSWTRKQSEFHSCLFVCVKSPS